LDAGQSLTRTEKVQKKGVDGKGLGKAADRKDLEASVNSCIENTLKGKTIKSTSQEMATLVTYLESLKKK